jgi:hypothetical protein
LSLATICGDEVARTTYFSGATLKGFRMRRLLLAAALAVCPMLAMADESISGQWQAREGHGVIIVMDILVDGHWASETVQDNRVVAELAGTYEQTKTTETSGKLVFTPVTSKTSAAHGAAKVEEDQYTLTGNGKVLRLVTGNEAMEFHKQPFATK